MMRSFILVPALALALTWVELPAHAADDEGTEATEQTPPVSARPPATYSLPKVGKARGRVGGGRRGTAGAMPDIYALVPDHVGYTTATSPTLLWYLSDKAEGDVIFEVTLIDQNSIEPLLDRRLKKPAQPGLQKVRLADFGVKLRPGEEYQWSISLVPDPNDRSKDVVSSGWIEVLPAPADLEARLNAAGPDGSAGVYGESGLWYDMLAALDLQMRRHPDETRYREDMAAILESAGLPTAAARTTQ